MSASSAIADPANRVLHLAPTHRLMGDNQPLADVYTGPTECGLPIHEMIPPLDAGAAVIDYTECAACWGATP